jgi:hypothetical protein
MTQDEDRIAKLKEAVIAATETILLMDNAIFQTPDLGLRNKLIDINSQLMRARYALRQLVERDLPSTQFLNVNCLNDLREFYGMGAYAGGSREADPEFCVAIGHKYPMETINACNIYLGRSVW